MLRHNGVEPPLLSRGQLGHRTHLAAGFRDGLPRQGHHLPRPRRHDRLGTRRHAAGHPRRQRHQHLGHLLLDLLQRPKALAPLVHVQRVRVDRLRRPAHLGQEEREVVDGHRIVRVDRQHPTVGRLLLGLIRVHGGVVVRGGELALDFGQPVAAREQSSRRYVPIERETAARDRTVAREDSEHRSDMPREEIRGKEPDEKAR